MHLYKIQQGALLVQQSKSYLIEGSWDELINRSRLYEWLDTKVRKTPVLDSHQWLSSLQAPVDNQEVWAAGVTYLRSRDARMEESKDSGAADVYQKVYEADRPELFFKALSARVAASGQSVFIRSDSAWNVPEPELTLFINSQGEIQAYTIGNDMSSRSIEGENPLYLPQAKIYEGSCALGPCLFVPAQPIAQETKISITILRSQCEVFSNCIQLNRMKRTLPELATWLYKSLKFPVGCFLMTGTGIVPPNDFTLQNEDEVTIAIEGIGTLTNTVAVLK